MPKMTDAELRAMLSSQHSSAMAASNASKLSGERENALDYYNGDMSKDMPAAPGRSSAVSMDVADTVEGIMPQLMEIFCGTDDVVKFEPVGPEDVEAAEQETDYTNHVFMNKNPGFLVLYSFIKDALLSKVGVVKVWWEKEEREERETYLDKTPDEYALIAANPEVEVVEHSENPGPDGLVLHDVTVVCKKEYAKARVMGVPPEEFGIEAGARSIRDCNYCFHKIVDRTEADLIEQGYDEAQVKKLPSYRAWTNSEETARDTVDEDSARADGVNRATRQVEITEHYVRMDYEGSGRSALYKVTTGGKDGEVLRLNGKSDIIEFDAIPFAAMTPIIVTHRFYGKSLADLVMDIQKIKTALLRALLDNAYLANNRRTEVPESHASENTLDDLLVSRPGGIIRTKLPNGIREIDFTPIGNHIYPLLEYQDATKETRTGVSKRGQGIEPDALQNQSATAAKIVENASQARVRLIARIFAETGIRDLFWLLHSTIKKHAQQAATERLRNKWVTVDPRQWKSREDLTVTVGLGTGGRAQSLMELSLIGQAQEKMLLGGMTNIVQPKHVYKLGAELVKAIGRPNVQDFFADPDEKGPDGQPVNPPPEPKPDPAMMKIQADAQMKQMELQQRGQELQVKAQLDQQADERKAGIEQVQAQADMATQDRKIQAEMMLAQQKFELEKELALLDFQLKREMQQEELAMKREAHQQALQAGAFKVAAGAEAHQQKMEMSEAKAGATE